MQLVKNENETASIIVTCALGRVNEEWVSIVCAFFW